MSTRTYLGPSTVVNAASMSADITSAVTVLRTMTKISYAVSWTGSSPVGAISVQVSNDYTVDATGKVANAGTWNTVTLQYNGSAVTSIPVSGNTGNGFVEVDNIAAFAIRLVYTFTSGTGALTATVVGKVA